MVRAKFKLIRTENSIYDKVTKRPDGGYDREPMEMRTLIFSPVYGNGDPDHENTKFWEASPSGEIKLGTVNQAAWEQFELGAEYYIDFTRADA